MHDGGLSLIATNPEIWLRDWPMNQVGEIYVRAAGEARDCLTSNHLRVLQQHPTAFVGSP